MRIVYALLWLFMLIVLISASIDYYVYVRTVTLAPIRLPAAVEHVSMGRK